MKTAEAASRMKKIFFLWAELNLQGAAQWGCPMGLPVRL